MPNLGVAIWRTILNIKLLCFHKVCAWITVITFTKIYWILPMHSNVSIKNVSWPHSVYCRAVASSLVHSTHYPSTRVHGPCSRSTFLILVAVLKKALHDNVFFNTGREHMACSNACPHYPCSRAVFTPVNTGSVCRPLAYPDRWL